MREVVTSTDILLANSNHPYFLIMDWSNKIALLRIPTECILTKRLESSLLVFTLEQKTFLIESYFLKGLKVNGSWIYSVQNCLEEFIVEFPIVIVDRKTFEDDLSRCVKLFRETKGVY
jgi:hypothetical protein